MVPHIMKPLFSRFFAAYHKRKAVLLEIMLSGNFLWSHSKEAFGESPIAVRACVPCLRQLEGTRQRQHRAQRGQPGQEAGGLDFHGTVALTTPRGMGPRYVSALSYSVKR